MQITKIINTTAFKAEDNGEPYKPTPDSKTVSSGRDWGDEFHREIINTKYHENGKLAELNFKYTNGKYASGEINEKYDKNGKNINYQA